MEVSGLVKDAKTKAPLPGATVGLYVGADELAVIPSDDNGEFTFSVGAEYVGQVLTCQVEKQGYETQKIEHKVAEEKVDLGIIELVPVREIAFSLRIKDETGNPLSGVNVSLDLDTGQLGSGRSDENGLFRMTLRPDLVGKTLKYTAKRLLYKTETGQIQIEKKENSAEITMKRIVFPLWAKIAAGIAAAVIVVAIVIAWLIPNGQVTVPNVIGQTESQATTTIAGAGLRKGRVTSRIDSATSGTVIEQQPRARSQVSKGTAIALVLAKAEPLVTVPSVIGQTESRATTTIAGAGLSKGRVSSRVDSATSGTVIEQQPIAGTRVSKGTAIALVLARSLPDLIAHYRFDGTPKDSTGISSDFTLSNTQYYRNTLYLNGNYEGDTGGGYKAIAQVSKLEYSHFTVTLDFLALQFGGARRVILIGGRSYRWFGLRWDGGYISLTFNNQRYQHTFKDGQISERRWHNVICSVDLERRIVLVVLNGRLLRQLTLPSNFKLDLLDQGSNVQNREREFTFTNYSYGGVSHGYVDNLRVYRRSMSGRDMARLHKEIHSETPTFSPPIVDRRQSSGRLQLNATPSPSTVAPGEKSTITVIVRDEQGRVIPGATVTVSAGGGKFLTAANTPYNPSARLHGPYSATGVADSNGRFLTWWVCNPCARAYVLAIKASKDGFDDGDGETTINIRQ